MVEHFSDYGAPQEDTTGYRSYQWSNAPFREDSDAIILSMTYLHGKNATFNGQANTPYFWATKEQVKGAALQSGQQLYYSVHVEQAQTTLADIADESGYQRFRYNADDKSSWLTYNFNNANEFNYLSPDECMIYAIGNSETVIRYSGYFRTQDNCDEQPEGYDRTELIKLENDRGDIIPTSSPALITSANNMIEAIENHSHSDSNTLSINIDTMASMKRRYDIESANLETYISPVFWQ